MVLGYHNRWISAKYLGGKLRFGDAVIDYRAYLQSDRWQIMRSRILARAKGCCERCGKPAIEPLEVHHLHYDTLGCERKEDLQALCPDCHGLADDERRDEP